MKKRKSLIAAGIVMAALLIVTVTPTFSWLSSQSEEVVNKFAGGTISILLDEAKVDTDGKAIAGEDRTTSNSYKYVAGAVLDKDPTPTVLKGSEECYVFLCVENGLSDKFTMNYDTQSWNAVSEDGNKTVYMYKEKVNALESETDVVLAPIFTTVTVAESLTAEDIESLGETTLSVTAYAVQTKSLEKDEAIKLAIDNFLGENETAE